MICTQYSNNSVHFLEKRHQHGISKLRTNGGGEFCSFKFQAFCASMGIKKQVTKPHSSHQNGVA